MRNLVARKATEFDSGTMHVPRQTEIPSSHPSVFYFSHPLFLSCVSAPSTFICYFFPEFRCCHGFLRRPEPPAFSQLLQRAGSILHSHERQVLSKLYEIWQIELVRFEQGFRPNVSKKRNLRQFGLVFTKCKKILRNAETLLIQVCSRTQHGLLRETDNRFHPKKMISKS